MGTELTRLLSCAVSASKMSQSDFVARSMASRMRKCIFTDQSYPSAWMVRFVLAVCPDGKHWAIPDVAERMPGRGAWIIPSAVALQAADEMDKFSYTFRKKVSCIPDVVFHVEKGLQDHCVQLLSQGRMSTTVLKQNGEPAGCAWKIVPWKGVACSPSLEEGPLVCDVLDVDRLRFLGYDASMGTEVRVSAATSKQLQREVFRLKTLCSTLDRIKNLPNKR